MISLAAGIATVGKPVRQLPPLRARLTSTTRASVVIDSQRWPHETCTDPGSGRCRLPLSALLAVPVALCPTRIRITSHLDARRPLLASTTCFHPAASPDGWTAGIKQLDPFATGRLPARQYRRSAARVM